MSFNASPPFPAGTHSGLSIQLLPSFASVDSIPNTACSLTREASPARLQFIEFREEILPVFLKLDQNQIVQDENKKQKWHRQVDQVTQEQKPPPIE
jgi:hypothetical protein